MSDSLEVHPIQTHHRYGREQAVIPAVLTKRAYEVYSHLYGTQQSLARLNERGGFGVLEIMAFLYAYPFPKVEWNARVDQALTGAKGFS